MFWYKGNFYQSAKVPWELGQTAIAEVSCELPHSVPSSLSVFQSVYESTQLELYKQLISTYKSSTVDVESSAMSPLTASDLRRIFETLDRNEDGFLSVEELNWLLDSIGDGQISDDLESLIGKSEIDLEEFLSLYKSISGKNRGGSEEEIERDLLNAFQVFDENRDGFICCEEVQNVLTRLGLWDERCGRDCSGMIRAYDTNLDGQLDFQEFKNMMLSASYSPCI